LIKNRDRKNSAFELLNNCAVNASNLKTKTKHNMSTLSRGLQRMLPSTNQQFSHNETCNSPSSCIPALVGLFVFRMPSYRTVCFTIALFATIMSISNTSAFDLVHEELVSGINTDVSIFETTGYIATKDGIDVYDLSSASNPAYIHHAHLQGAYSIIIVDSLLIVNSVDPTYTTWTISIYSISTPNVPGLLGRILLDRKISVPVAYDNFLYIAYEGHGVGVISLMNPSHPELISSFDRGSPHLMRIMIRDNHLFATEAIPGTRLFVYELENPESPNLIHQTIHSVLYTCA